MESESDSDNNDCEFDSNVTVLCSFTYMLSGIVDVGILIVGFLELE